MCNAATKQGVEMIETRIIIKNYIRQLEYIKDNIEDCLPEECKQYSKDIFGLKTYYFPIMSELESLISNMKDDTQGFYVAENHTTKS